MPGRGWEFPDKGDFKVSLKPTDDYLMTHINRYARAFDDYPPRDTSANFAKSSSCGDFKVDYDKVQYAKDIIVNHKAKKPTIEFKRYKPRDDNMMKQTEEHKNIFWENRKWEAEQRALKQRQVLDQARKER